MSSTACLEAPVKIQSSEPSRQEIADACRAIRKTWSRDQRTRRKQLADVKQVGLLLNTVDLSSFYQKLAG